jgi:hypothetical protein
VLRLPEIFFLLTFEVGLQAKKSGTDDRRERLGRLVEFCCDGGLGINGLVIEIPDGNYRVQRLVGGKLDRP